MPSFRHRSDDLPRRRCDRVGRLDAPSRLRKLRTISHPLAPFLLERELLPKVWGGRALRDQLGIHVEDDAGPIGESWELYDRPAGSSRIRGTSETLAALTRRCPEELVGPGVRLGHEGAFPLMLKFLDAREALSLQVHPDDARARGDLGKDECCLVLHVERDARFVHGLRPGVTRDALIACWGTSAVEEMLYSFRPEVGQLVHIPPGTLHAMGPGVVAFEVQDNSDLTYRLYDWGRDREVHPDRARDVVEMVHHDRSPVERSTSLADGGDSGSDDGARCGNAGGDARPVPPAVPKRAPSSKSAEESRSASSERGGKAPDMSSCARLGAAARGSGDSDSNDVPSPSSSSSSSRLGWRLSSLGTNERSSARGGGIVAAAAARRRGAGGDAVSSAIARRRSASASSAVPSLLPSLLFLSSSSRRRRSRRLLRSRLGGAGLAARSSWSICALISSIFLLRYPSGPSAGRRDVLNVWLPTPGNPNAA